MFSNSSVLYPMVAKMLRGSGFASRFLVSLELVTFIVANCFSIASFISPSSSALSASLISFFSLFMSPHMVAIFGHWRRTCENFVFLRLHALQRYFGLFGLPCFWQLLGSWFVRQS